MTHARILNRILDNYYHWCKAVGQEEAGERAAALVPDEDWDEFIRLMAEREGTKVTATE